ncbi:MAG: NIPSNAP family protein [Actinomycetota bacterium]|nr:NIPSNAP family protein [Actinomycetota bacterium]
MQYQLRSYEVRPGEMEEWLEEWSRLVLPLRLEHGFELVGAWRVEDGDRFVWILAYDGDFATADADYYASPARAALDPDPARHLENAETRMLHSVVE